MNLFTIYSNQTAWYKEHTRLLQIASDKIKWEYPEGRKKLIQRSMVVIQDIAKSISFIRAIPFALIPGFQISKEMQENNDKIDSELLKLYELLENLSDKKEFEEGAIYSKSPQNLPKIGDWQSVIASLPLQHEKANNNNQR